jgi:hypothetical protein
MTQRSKSHSTEYPDLFGAAVIFANPRGWVLLALVVALTGCRLGASENAWFDLAGDSRFLTSRDCVVTELPE